MSRLRAALILLGFAALAACAAPVDLSAVSKYASTTAQAGTSFSALAADFKESCLRYNEAQDYLVEGRISSTPPTLIGAPTIAELKEAVSIESFNLEPGYTAVPITSVPGAAVSLHTAPAHDVCKDADDVSAAWNQANTTVLSYVQALGNLANVDAVPTANPSPLATALAKAGVSSADIQAGSAVLGTISKFFTNQAAQKDIRGFLVAVNPSMPGAIESLEVVDTSYSLELQDEYAAIETQYAPYVREELSNYEQITGTAQESVNQRSLIARTLLQKRAAVVSALAFINNQRKACVAYGAAIEQILKTHEQLYAASQRSATLSDYISIVQTTGAPVLTNLETLAKGIK
jgi:hypothetical protein